ncbi:MAG: exonuclease domain-containing protein [Candidatus Nanopelagicales bacterium]|nr:exonuclease domain-containing protein [Candidatus Nanopelagicales bacterium]
MTRWRVFALIAVATVVPALTVAVVLADLPAGSRQDLVDAVRGQVWVMALGLVLLVGLIGWIAWSTWRAEQHQDERTASAVRMIADVNPEHRLPGGSATEDAINVLAARHASAESRLSDQLEAAHAELRLERDGLLAVLTGLDVPVGVVDDRGRVLLVNPAARSALRGRTPLAAGRSIFGVFDAEDFMPLLAQALDGHRPRAVVRGTAILLVRITGPGEPAMVLVVGNPSELDPTGPNVGLSVDLARPSRPVPSRAEWLQTPLADIVFTVVDCETTGLHVDAGDRLVAIGAVRVDAAVVRADDTFDALINPGRPIPALSTSFHGITDEMVVGAATATEVVAEFSQYAADSVLVAHHTGFDFGFLRPVAERADVPLEALSLDTMLLSAVLDPDPEARHGLDYVCRRFGVEVFGRHTALGDALATAEVFVRMVPRLAEMGIVTLGQAREASARTELSRRILQGGS